MRFFADNMSGVNLSALMKGGRPVEAV